MTEYAKLKTNYKTIKIGVGYFMYYLRYEHAHLVDYFDNKRTRKYEDCKTIGYYFRVPFHNECYLNPGDYGYIEGQERGYHLSGFPVVGIMLINTRTISLKNEQFGIEAKIPCTHGGELPSTGEHIKMSYVEKASHYIEFIYVKHQDDGLLYPVIRCRFCGQLWICDWEDIIPFINDSFLLSKIEQYIKRNNNYMMNKFL